MNKFKKPFLEFVLNASICTVLIQFLQFNNWIKSIQFGIVFGIVMMVFYIYILPKFKKKK